MLSLSLSWGSGRLACIFASAGETPAPPGRARVGDESRVAILMGGALCAASRVSVRQEMGYGLLRLSPPPFVPPADNLCDCRHGRGGSHPRGRGPDADQVQPRFQVRGSVGAISG